MADDRGADKKVDKKVGKKKDEAGKSEKIKIHGAYMVGDRLVGIPPHW